MVKQLHEQQDELYQELTRHVAASIKRMIHNADVAEDLTQEVLLRYWLFRDKIKSTRRWLAQVITNLCCDYYRESARSKNVSYEVLDSSLVSEHFDVEDTIIRQELMVAFREAISRLPARSQQVFCFREIEGYSYSKISSALNMSVSQVRGILYRSRNSVREYITTVCQAKSDFTSDPPDTARPTVARPSNRRGVS